VRDDEKMKVKTLNLYSSNDLNYILGHKKADKAKIPKSYCFILNVLKLNPNQAIERCHPLSRVTLAPFRENAASWSKTLALLGLVQAATRAKTAKVASQNIHTVG
jgi:hypothetical protein